MAHLSFNSHQSLDLVSQQQGATTQSLEDCAMNPMDHTKCRPCLSNNQQFTMSWH